MALADSAFRLAKTAAQTSLQVGGAVVSRVVREVTARAPGGADVRASPVAPEAADLPDTSLRNAYAHDAAAAPMAPAAVTEAPAAPPEPLLGPEEPTPVEPDELVATSADPGAEDTPGAAIRVEEPWEGYGGMTAGAITDRLVVADAATLTAVGLYEASHRKRKTVVEAVEKRMREVS